jgi:hypothetical protein
MRLRAGCLGLGAVWLAISVTAASQVRSVNLEQMTERAATIFAGRCIAVRTESDRALGRDVSVATFAVHRAVKGVSGRIVTVRMATSDDSGTGVADPPIFRKADEVVLFLYGESALGLSAPVGLGQGRFKVAPDKRGRPVAINDLGNRNLLRELSPAARGRLARISVPGEGGEALGPTALLDMAEALAASEP